VIIGPQRDVRKRQIEDIKKAPFIMNFVRLHGETHNEGASQL
jgi:hypothetical protein